jgi:hypothetical protein
MSLEIPVFDTKNVKRTFYYFFALNVILTLGVIIIPTVFDISFTHILGRNDNWVLFLALFAGNYFFAGKSRRELQAIMATTDIPEKFLKYENYYKQKLIYNFFTLVIASIVIIFIGRAYFLFLLGLQLVLSLMHYPTKKLLSKELQVEGIVFT